MQKDNFVSSLEKKYPKYHKLKYESATVSIQDVQKKVLKEDECLLEYFVNKEAIYVFRLQKTTTDFIKIPKDSSFYQDIRLFRRALSGFSFLSEQPKLSYELFTETSHKLYQNILAPVLADVSAHSLIIVPSDVLGHIPFEALLETASSEEYSRDIYRRLDYLLHKFEVAYSYSSTVLLNNLEQSSQTPNSQLLAFAADYKDIDSAKTSLRSPVHVTLRRHLLPLPAAQKEVEDLEQLYEGQFLYKAASNEASFKELAPQYGIIHLAMHGILDKKHPMQSSLAFTENGDSLEDNFAHAYELSNMKLNAGLVVLSACETGYGKFQQGEGIMSLANSFMHAGVPSLLVSLWQVNDQSTATLMKFFYKELANGVHKNKALCQAKLRYLKNAQGIAAHPAFWAPFIQLGDTTPISLELKNSGFSWVFYLLICSGVVLLTMVLYYKKRSTNPQ
ncbi:MAG: CHAT domain-containing protein [Aureispira sp.]|nr:CHAT domain-containing protein [Aureispira sp.]